MNNRTFDVGKIIGMIDGVLGNEIPRHIWEKMSQFLEDQNDELTEELISFVEMALPETPIKEIILLNLEDFLSQ